MVKEKLKLTKQILQENPNTCRDGGTGHFLNVVAKKLYPNGKIDFREFKTESWERARRKVLELNPELDQRTSKTEKAESQIRKEVA